MGDPQKMQAEARAAWLAETFRRNRERFGGWFMEATGDTGGESGASGDGSDAGSGAPGGSEKEPPWGDDANFDAAKAWQTIQNLRKEKGGNAALQAELDELKQAQQAQQDAIAKALGLKEDEAPDPAKLAQQITAEQAKVTEAETRAAAAERKLAVVVASSKHDANLNALLDSASFLDSIKEIDPADTAAISAAVKKAVDEHDHFKATPPPPSFFGGARKTTGKPDPGPGLPRLRDAYAQTSK